MYQNRLVYLSVRRSLISVAKGLVIPEPNEFHIEVLNSHGEGIVFFTSFGKKFRSMFDLVFYDHGDTVVYLTVPWQAMLLTRYFVALSCESQSLEILYSLYCVPFRQSLYNFISYHVVTPAGQDIFRSCTVGVV